MRSIVLPLETNAVSLVAIGNQCGSSCYHWKPMRSLVLLNAVNSLNISLLLYKEK
jgi:hypothetical protein